ncbi:hypothetical protein [Sinomonas halotolerans]|uniref:Uncharacterized protein n=1 Tax=Sinomonas halotolerans TaxID=1644133 RepID=A0ABU9WYY8_9MICC
MATDTGVDAAITGDSGAAASGAIVPRDGLDAPFDGTRDVLAEDTVGAEDPADGPGIACAGEVACAVAGEIAAA